MDMVVHRFNDRIREDLVRIALDKDVSGEKNGGEPFTTDPRLRETWNELMVVGLNRYVSPRTKNW